VSGVVVGGSSGSGRNESPRTPKKARVARTTGTKDCVLNHPLTGMNARPREGCQVWKIMGRNPELLWRSPLTPYSPKTRVRNDFTSRRGVRCSRPKSLPDSLPVALGSRERRGTGVAHGDTQTLRPRPWAAISRLLLVGGVSSIAMVILIALIRTTADLGSITFRVVLYFVPGLIGLAAYVLLRKGRLSRAWWLGLGAGALAVVVATVFTGGLPFVGAVIESFNIVQFVVNAPDWFAFEASRTVIVLAFLGVLLQCAYLLLVIAGVWSLMAHLRGRHPRESITP